MSLTIISLIGILIISYLLVVNFYPSFGGDVTKELQQQYSTSVNFKDGKFANKTGVPKDPSFSEILKISRKFFFEKVKNGRPKNDLNIQKIDSANVADYKDETRLIWYGHSSFLLQTDGKNILLDPMFGQVAAPLSFLGEKRFNKQMPLEIEKLPQIDAVVISHDHYDHLDYESIKKLKSKVEHYFVPLGVSVHLKAWGIPDNKITELDWWQETTYKDIQFVCTPSQHFSGRKMNNRQSTLWSSWVIKSKTNNLYFSGDSGYEKHFKVIGEKYGPFDFAMLECGQYNEMWSDIHMMPEETAQAGVDLQAKKIMPIHWAGFKLAMHSWTDPITRVSKKAKELNLPLIAPKIGEPIIVNDSTQVYQNWWKDL
ncbi:membrane protein [Tenacibaculum holothuriorum]|uniref:Membrane protein n=1 Tax=Tenacibaculum holothuriorum TaxID=1635173 RepID=A0A1Y2PA83_9FLAO|nr:MBL fold metallo-hydrolase [Tenacibaculum holothuriorum]OSY86941.1 membrane protein [Tenacibaculum holothuriorum]